jgi:hypothetical protein
MKNGQVLKRLRVPKHALDNNGGLAKFNESYAFREETTLIFFLGTGARSRGVGRIDSGPSKGFKRAVKPPDESHYGHFHARCCRHGI